MTKEKRFNVEEHPTLDGRVIDVFPISHRYIHDLEQQVEKQKEAINKAIEYISSQMIAYDDDGDCGVDCECDGFKLLDILKEVE